MCLLTPRMIIIRDRPGIHKQALSYRFAKKLQKIYHMHYTGGASGGYKVPPSPSVDLLHPLGVWFRRLESYSAPLHICIDIPLLEFVL